MGIWFFFQVRLATLLYIGIAFFNLLPSIFQWGNPPCGLGGRPCGAEDFTEAGNRPPIFRYRCVLQQWHRPSAPISDIEKISTMSRERHEMVGCPKNTSYSRFWYEKNEFTHANMWYFLKNLCRKKEAPHSWTEGAKTIFNLKNSNLAWYSSFLLEKIWIQLFF